MAKNTIPNSRDGLNICIVSCKWAKWRNSDPTAEFDYECTCEEECKNFDKFDVTDLRKHEEDYIREQAIRDVVPVVMDFFNDLMIDCEGVHFYRNDDNGEDKAQMYEKVMEKVNEALNK